MSRTLPLLAGIALALFLSGAALPPGPARQEVKNCAICHGKPSYKRLIRRGGETADLYVDDKTIARSVHYRSSCTDCHADVESLPHENITPKPVDCTRCHEAALRLFERSVHGVALLLNGIEDAPTCASCHGSHNIYPASDPRSRVYVGNVSRVCAECHEAMALTGKYGIEGGRLETYEKSFHGLAIRFGSTLAANCASCHGHHDILPSSDPRSSVHPDNIPKTCGQEGCHPGAGKNFAIGKVHVDPRERESGLVFYITQFFTFFTAAVILALVAHIGLDLLRRFLGPRGAKREGPAQEKGES